MESFWEKVLDILFTLLKAFVLVVAIRVLCLLIDLPFPIPFVDDILFELYYMVTGQVPEFRSY